MDISPDKNTLCKCKLPIYDKQIHPTNKFFTTEIVDVFEMRVAKFVSAAFHLPFGLSEQILYRRRRYLRKPELENEKHAGKSNRFVKSAYVVTNK